MLTYTASATHSRYEIHVRSLINNYLSASYAVFRDVRNSRTLVCVLSKTEIGLTLEVIRFWSYSTMTFEKCYVA